MVGASGSLRETTADPKAPPMQTDRFTPEIAYTPSPRVACDGASDTWPALGHPRVYLQIDEKGYVDCGYCDKRFILKGGPADEQAGAAA
jgi:NADH dehydrogenase (ubiquinone) Fe-S protein 6